MKCQKCKKSATFHITDLTGDELLALHLCPDCAKQYLQSEDTDAETPEISGVLSQQLKLEQTAEELKELDARECPICGISFYEFRQAGTIGVSARLRLFRQRTRAIAAERPRQQ